MSTRIHTAVLAHPRTSAQVQARCYACVLYAVAGPDMLASGAHHTRRPLADPARPSQL